MPARTDNHVPLLYLTRACCPAAACPHHPHHYYPPNFLPAPAPVTTINQIDKCFGFDTAVEEAQRALLAAKVEATSGYKGLGIVKLMGRSSGFIAMQASMASGKRVCCVGVLGVLRW